MKLSPSFLNAVLWTTVSVSPSILYASNTDDLPKEALNMARIYASQKEKLEEQIKQSYLRLLRQRQAEYAQKQQFDQIAEIQKVIQAAESMPPSELFAPKKQEIPIRHLVGTWECIGKNNIRTSITINPDGQCTRLDNGQKPKAQWGWAFQVRKTGDNQFIFFSPSIKEILGRFHFVDDDTFDMPWHGSCLYKRKKE